MSEEMICPVCKNQVPAFSARVKSENGRFTYCRVECSLCGHYLISSTAQAVLKQDALKHYVLSAFLRNKYENSIVFELHEYNYEEIEQNTTEPNINEKIDLVLQYLDKKQTQAGGGVQFVIDHDFPLFYMKNRAECSFVFNTMRDLNYIHHPGTTDWEKDKTKLACTLSLKFAGIQRLYDIQHKNIDSLKCFVAYRQQDSTADTIKAIKETFKDEEISAKGLWPYLVNEDLKNENEKTLFNKIIAGIKTSRCLIADYTCDDALNQNIYYEVGYAMGFRIPVIMMCDEKVFKDKDLKERIIRFDMAGHHFITYKDRDDLKEQLIQSIKANVF